MSWGDEVFVSKIIGHIETPCFVLEFLLFHLCSSFEFFIWKKTSLFFFTSSYSFVILLREGLLLYCSIQLRYAYLSLFLSVPQHGFEGFEKRREPILEQRVPRNHDATETCWSCGSHCDRAYPADGSKNRRPSNVVCP